MQRYQALIRNTTLLGVSFWLRSLESRSPCMVRITSPGAFQNVADPHTEAMLASIKSAYSDNMKSIDSRLRASLSAGSTAVYGAPTPAYQSVLSSISAIAQARLSQGVSAASSQYADGKAYVAAVQTPAPAKQNLLGQIQHQYYAGLGMAYARYSDFVDSASAAVMPRKTPIYESIYSGASEVGFSMFHKPSSHLML